MIRNILATVVVVLIGVLAVNEANAMSLWQWTRTVQTEANQLTVDSADDVDIHVHGQFTVFPESAVLTGLLCREETCVSIYEEYTIKSLSSSKLVAEVVDRNGVDYTVHIFSRTKDSREDMTLMFVDPPWGSTTTHTFKLVKFPIGGPLVSDKEGVTTMEAVHILQGL